MERTETPVLWRKPPVTENPRSCGCRASALLCTATGDQKLPIGQKGGRMGVPRPQQGPCRLKRFRHGIEDFGGGGNLQQSTAGTMSTSYQNLPIDQSGRRK